MANEFPLVSELVRWDDTDPMALIDQLRAKVMHSLREGEKVAFVSVLIRIDPKDGQPIYSSSHSLMSQEFVLMAAEHLRRTVNRTIEAQNS